MSAQPQTVANPVPLPPKNVDPWDEPLSVSAEEYVGALFSPDDLICIMTLQDETPRQTFVTASEATSPKFMDRLRKQNDASANIYVCMNPLTAKQRVKANVASIRTVYLDIDKNGEAALKRISESPLVPKPHFVLQSSPGKFQVIWLVKDIQPADQERLLDALIQEFGGDRAASDMTRVLRLPGFANCKYDSKPIVEVVESHFDGARYTLAAFHVKVAASFKKAEPLCDSIPLTERNTTLTSLAGSMRRRGMSEDAMLAALRVENENRCSPPLPDNEVAKIAHSIVSYEPAVASTQTPFAESGTNPTAEIISVLASEVVPVPIEFLWEPYLQQDALNAFYGNPSVGKGNTAMDIVARLTTGRPYPTEASTLRKPMRCVILAAEEGVENTLVPRLIAAGADLKLVRIIKSVRVHGKNDEISERLITFQTDMAAVKKDLQAHPEEHFLLIDPITNYVGDINFNQDGEVRPVLTMLAQLAEELRITILIVGHFNKNTNVASALDKPGGGRAWTAVPRACWGFFRQPDNKRQRMMVNLKVNNAEESDTGLMFTIETRIIGTKPDGKSWGVSGVEWGEKTDATADDMVSAEHPEAQQNNKGVKFLNDLLQKRAQQATKVYEKAEAEGIHERTIKRACIVIGVLKFKLPSEGWTWQHPNDPTPIPDAASNLNREAQRRRGQEAQLPSAEVEVF